MRRAGLWLLNGLTVLSLLLLVAAVSFWVRSYFIGESWLWYTAHPRSPEGSTSHQWHISSNCGKTRIGYATKDHVAGVTAIPGPLLYRRGAARPLPADSSVQPSLATSLGIYTSKTSLGKTYGMPVKRPARTSDMEFAATEWRLLFPDWTVALLSGLLPARTAYKIRSRRRNRVGHGKCGSCSYDLTANVSGVCPECGTAIVKGTG